MTYLDEFKHYLSLYHCTIDNISTITNIDEDITISPTKFIEACEAYEIDSIGGIYKVDGDSRFIVSFNNDTRLYVIAPFSVLSVSDIDGLDDFINEVF